MDDRQRSQPVEQCVEIRSHEQKNPLSSSDNGFRLIDDESTKHIDPKEFADDHIDEFEELVCNRGFLKQHCIRHGDARYCIKEVRQELEGYILADGALDICIEAKFLSVISHPNIIRLCGMSKVSGGDPRTFLILDRLYDTVATRITSWEASVKKMKKGLFGNMKHKQEVKQLWNERLLAMYDIARAVKYLHLNNILHRDIKPENAGFDIHGNVKLFDLGLAKELREKDRIGHDLFKLSGGTGTRRFMSPESVLCLPYGKPSDVYSFAILCWQVLALEKPFNGWNHEKHLKYVVQKGMRPKIPKDWPTLIKYLIEICWSVKPVDRPNFDRICAMLKGDLATSDMSLSNRTESLMDDSLINRELHQMTV